MQLASASRLRSPWFWLAIGLTAVYVRGLFLDLMDVDAAQYASISMEMLQGGHWLQVLHQHTDYLDKPPLLFWSAALMFRVVGVHVWAFKLPSVLAVGGAAVGLYRLARLYYPVATATSAALILATSVGVVLATNDVRTDALLMAMTTLAVWQAAEFIDGNHAGGGWPHALFTGAFVGLAMLAKGPIGAVMPAFAIGTHLILRRQWQRFFRWEWFAMLAVVAVVLAPMCWGLYQQFDLHPEKVVNGRTDVSGLAFFFWEQSFGRITGANVWRNKASPLYFVQIYLWAFLPWPIFLIGALWRRMRELIVQRFRVGPRDEALSIGGFLLTFIALSMSHYKLPHYIFITLPWASILVARWFGCHAIVGRGWWRAQYFVFALLAFVCGWLLVAAFPTTSAVRWIGTGGLFATVAVLCWRSVLPLAPARAVLTTATAGLATAFTLNFHFYPASLPFQSTITIPKAAASLGIPSAQMASFNRHGHAMDFYAGRILPIIATPEGVGDSATAHHDLWVYTDSAGRAQLDAIVVPYTVTLTAPQFDVAQPTIPFLRAATRASTLHPSYLLHVTGRRTP